MAPLPRFSRPINVKAHCLAHPVLAMRAFVLSCVFAILPFISILVLLLINNFIATPFEYFFVGKGFKVKVDRYCEWMMSRNCWNTMHLLFGTKVSIRLPSNDQERKVLMARINRRTNTQQDSPRKDLCIGNHLNYIDGLYLCTLFHAIGRSDGFRIAVIKWTRFVPVLGQA